MADVRFYLDENVQIIDAQQLILRGIDVVTVRSLELLGDEDENHLVRATSMGRVLCTHDTDYYELAKSGSTLD
jgi:predicted nuclease of predicted toxin-antitoxin system